jgi:adenylate cyclase
MTPTAIAVWLAEQGLQNLPLEELVDGFARRLGEAGLPVARIFVGMNTLHPLVRTRSLIWDRASGPATHFEFQHAEIDKPVMRQSPFAPMLDRGVAEERFDLTRPARADEPPVFTELRSAGMTDWLGRIFPFGERMPEMGRPQSAEHAGALWLACSVTTDWPGGFAEYHLDELQRLLPMFALAVKAITMRAVGEGLLAAYLGADPARRVMSGAVQRGVAHDVEAALLFADLRSFTPLADALPAGELMALLDQCFDCLARPLTRLGGEILKFMGDGLLAIFRTDERHRSETCAAALAAASDALDLLDLLAAERLAKGRPTPGLDIALHVGTVQYGNVGTEGRLDFTVIGPAVNEAARIEALCGPLGHSLLVSQAFASVAERSRDHLVSVGRHRLRGVREETELFALAQASPTDHNAKA